MVSPLKRPCHPAMAAARRKSTPTRTPLLDNGREVLALARAGFNCMSADLLGALTLPYLPAHRAVGRPVMKDGRVASHAAREDTYRTSGALVSRASRLWRAPVHCDSRLPIRFQAVLLEGLRNTDTNMGDGHGQVSVWPHSCDGFKATWSLPQSWGNARVGVDAKHSQHRARYCVDVAGTWKPGAVVNHKQATGPAGQNC